MVFTSHLARLFKCDLMNIYKVFQLGMICLCFPATSFWIPTPLSLQISVKHSDLQSVPVHKRIYSFSLLFSFDKFLWNGISSLEWICWETHAGVCTVTVMVIRLLFHLESNIMMTLKLDMKHICKKEVRKGGGGYLDLGGVSGRQEGSSAPTQRGRQGAQSFSEEGIQM